MHEKTNDSSGNTAHYLCSTTVFITSHLFPFARSHTRLRRRQKFSRSTHTHTHTYKRLFFFFLVTTKHIKIGRGFAFFFSFSFYMASKQILLRHPNSTLTSFTMKPISSSAYRIQPTHYDKTVYLAENATRTHALQS